MKIITTPTYTATVTIGRQIGYTDAHYSKDKFIGLLQQFQQEQILKRKVYMSASITECDIVLSGQIEPHFKLDFINYPKFPLEEAHFKSAVELLAINLMEELAQNRLVIVFHNETKMLEKTDGIDPRI